MFAQANYKLGSKGPKHFKNWASTLNSWIWVFSSHSVPTWWMLFFSHFHSSDSLCTDSSGSAVSLLSRVSDWLAANISLTEIWTRDHSARRIKVKKLPPNFFRCLLFELQYTGYSVQWKIWHPVCDLWSMRNTILALSSEEKRSVIWRWPGWFAAGPVA